MKKLNKKEAIAVFVGIGLLTYLFFRDPLMALFNLNMQNSNNPTDSTESATQNLPQTKFQSKDVSVGSGELAEPGDKLKVHYLGKLVDGRVFDSSFDRGVPIELTLGVGQVIRGWDEGLVGMREGGKRVLTIAPDYGYGSRGVGSIPANSVLIFEVELVDVEKSR